MDSSNVDPNSHYIVTFEFPPVPGHDPRAKRTGGCPMSRECTDTTGAHHSRLMFGVEVVDFLRNTPLRIIRVELVSPTEIRSGPRAETKDRS